MNSLRSITSSTPNGDFSIIVDSNDIARVSGFGSLDELAKRLPEELRSSTITPTSGHAYEAKIKAYFDGNLSALDAIARHQDGSEFQKSVWQAISAIPHGKTISYKQLAEAANSPAAIRAAGTICGLNRLILLIPCHRVLKSDGGIGSYLYGSPIKEALLQHEGVL